MIATPNTPLSSIVERFEAAWLSTRAAQTRKLYRIGFQQFGEYLGRVPMRSDVTDETVAPWLPWLRDVKGLNPITVNGRRSKFLTFWRWGCRKGFFLEWPDVAAIAQAEKIPRGWTVAQIRKLLDAASTMPCSVCGVQSSLWWQAYIRVAFDTGERTGAMLALRWDWLDGDELDVPGSARKAGKAARYGLRAETLAALRLIREPQRKLIFAWDRDPVVFYTRWRSICLMAGVRHHPPKSLRISFASHLEAGGGNATEALQHSSRTVTRKSYLDPSIVKRDRACDKLPEL